MIFSMNGHPPGQTLENTRSTLCTALPAVWSTISGGILYWLYPSGQRSTHEGQRSQSDGDHAKIVLADPNAVAGVQLTTTAGLGLVVDQNRLGGEKPLDFAAAVDDPGELQQLAEPDHLSTNRDLAGHRANLALAEKAHDIPRIGPQRSGGAACEAIEGIEHDLARGHTPERHGTRIDQREWAEQPIDRDHRLV
jgi:hypothetical protein